MAFLFVFKWDCKTTVPTFFLATRLAAISSSSSLSSSSSSSSSSSLSSSSLSSSSDSSSSPSSSSSVSSSPLSSSSSLSFLAFCFLLSLPSVLLCGKNGTKITNYRKTYMYKVMYSHNVLLKEFCIYRTTLKCTDATKSSWVESIFCSVLR